MRIFEVGTVFRATNAHLQWKITGIDYDNKMYAWEYTNTTKAKDVHASSWKWEQAEADLANNEIELVSVPVTRLDMEVLGDDI